MHLKRSSSSMHAHHAGPLEAPKTEVVDDELRELLGKGTYPVYLDFSCKDYALTSDAFLLLCPDAIKEYNCRVPLVVPHTSALRLRGGERGALCVEAGST
jgi:hypothetical protein